MKTGIADWAYAAQTAPGYSESGDRHLVGSLDDGVLIAAIDGLGHGPEAARASGETAATLAKAEAGESLSQLMGTCHTALHRTRGATASLARFEAGSAQLAWLAVGNVHGQIVRRTPVHGRRDKSLLLLLPGVVGGQLPRLRESVLPMACGDVLALMTDSVIPNAAERLDTRHPACEIAQTVLEQGAHGQDDALVVVARYMG